MVEEIIGEIGLDVANVIGWGEQELFRMAQRLRKITKPMVIACNKMDIPGAADNFSRIKSEFPNYLLIPCSAESELALREAAKHDLIEYIPGENDFKIKNESKLTPKQRNALGFIKDNILDKFGSTGVQQVLDQAVFNILKYMHIFPGGVNKLADQDGRILPDCFLMPPESTALDFAFRLHSDFGNNFIRAIDVKTKKTVGKEHKLRPGDVVEIIAGK